MLDVDAVIWEMEVGLVLALVRRGGIVLVGCFVFVGDAVEIEVVRDLAFLVTLDLLALQGTDVVAASAPKSTSMTHFETRQCTPSQRHSNLNRRSIRRGRVVQPACNNFGSQSVHGRGKIA